MSFEEFLKEEHNRFCNRCLKEIIKWDYAFEGNYYCCRECFVKSLSEYFIQIGQWYYEG